MSEYFTSSDLDPAGRQTSALRRISACAALVTTIGIAGGLVTHFARGGASATPSISAPRLPKGTPNFNPLIKPGSSWDVQQIENVTEANQAETTDLEYSDGYYGYAEPAEVNGEPAMQLLAGAEVIPGKNGSVEIKPLYGAPKDIRLSYADLQHGPSAISLGGDYTMQVGLDPNDNQPALYYGPLGQTPDDGTFVNQPSATVIKHP